MKNAKEMYTLSQKVQLHKEKEERITRALSNIQRIITAHAEEGKTDVTIHINEIGFDCNFMFTMGNLDVIAKRVSSFGYKTTMLFDEQTCDVTLHVNWKLDPIEQVFQNLGSILDLDPHF